MFIVQAAGRNPTKYFPAQLTQNLRRKILNPSPNIDAENFYYKYSGIMEEKSYITLDPREYAVNVKMY